MKAVVGEESLSDLDKLHLEFTQQYIDKFVTQGPYEYRTIFDSLEIGWQIMRTFGRNNLVKIKKSTLDEFYPRKA